MTLHTARVGGHQVVRQPCPECGELKPWHASSCSHAQSERRWPVMLTERQVGILVSVMRADTTVSPKEYAELYDHLAHTETTMHNEVNSG
jgi:hypothetical protein